MQNAPPDPPSEPAPHRPWGPGAAVAVLATVLFFGIGWAVLEVAHPAEDAYILFRYAENLASGDGIAFNPGGERAEGATDFLWLVGVAAVAAAGADVAVAALAWNALGAGLLAWLLARPVLRAPGVGGPWRWACAVLPLAVVASDGALAGYVGFSSMLFPAACVGLAALAADGRGATLRAVPWLGLAVALFRPEGVVVGGVATAVGALRAHRAGDLSRYAGAAVLAALGGAAYFAGRALYFGEWLPLPLQVKGRGAPAVEGPGALGLGAWSQRLPGLLPNLYWIARPEGPLPPLVATALIGLGWLRRERAAWGTAAALALPFVALYAVLLFPVQSQNVHWRFQAPVFAGLLYALFRAAGAALARAAGTSGRAAVVACLLAGTLPWAVPVVSQLASLRRPAGDYMNTFAALLGAHLTRDDVVVLTEAGRVPFWTDARVIDVAGLNTPAMAAAPPRLADLRALAPDVVFFHHAGTLDPTVLKRGAPGRPRVLPLGPETLAAAVRPPFASLYRDGAASWDDTPFVSVRVGPVVLTRFLVEEADRYELFAVDADGTGTWYHVYGLRRDWPGLRGTRRALRKSLQPGTYRSYLELERTPFPPAPRQP